MCCFYLDAVCNTIAPLIHDKNSNVNYHFFQQLTRKQEVSLREYKRRRFVKWELHPVIICGPGSWPVSWQVTSGFSPTW